MRPPPNFNFNEPWWCVRGRLSPKLNMYSFSKTRHDANWREFKQPYFQRGQRHLLRLIRRKNSNSASNQRTYSGKLQVDTTQTVDRVSEELKILQGRVGALETQIWLMNEKQTALLREVQASRELLGEGDIELRQKAIAALQQQVLQPSNGPPDARQPLPSTTSMVHSLHGVGSGFPSLAAAAAAGLPPPPPPPPPPSPTSTAPSSGIPFTPATLGTVPRFSPFPSLPTSVISASPLRPHSYTSPLLGFGLSSPGVGTGNGYRAALGIVASAPDIVAGVQADTGSTVAAAAAGAEDDSSKGEGEEVGIEVIGGRGVGGGDRPQGRGGAGPGVAEAVEAGTGSGVGEGTGVDVGLVGEPGAGVGAAEFMHGADVGDSTGPTHLLLAETGGGAATGFGTGAGLTTVPMGHDPGVLEAAGDDGRFQVQKPLQHGPMVPPLTPTAAATSPVGALGPYVGRVWGASLTTGLGGVGVGMGSPYVPSPVTQQVAGSAANLAVDTAVPTVPAATVMQRTGERQCAGGPGDGVGGGSEEGVGGGHVDGGKGDLDGGAGGRVDGAREEGSNVCNEGQGNMLKHQMEEGPEGKLLGVAEGRAGVEVVGRARAAKAARIE